METQEQGTVTQEEVQEAGEQEAVQKEKTFTQEEVDKIIQKRLTREREKISKAFQEGTRESDLDERERNILKRELKADTLEKLAANNMPLGLANLVDYESEESCKDSMESVLIVFNQAVHEAVKAKARQSTPREGIGSYAGRSDGLATAFNVKR